MKRDPSLRLAVSSLSSSIPALAALFEEGQDFVADSPKGKVRGTVRGGRFEVKALKESAPSIIQPTSEGRKHISNVLRKSGYAEGLVQSKLQRFDSAPENVRIRVTETMDVVKWSITSLTPDLRGPHIADDALFKIAYEFLVCHLDSLAYSDNPAVEALRRTLRGKEAGGRFRVEHLLARRRDPLHGLAFEGNCPHAIVQIRLFGTRAYRVHFQNLAVRGPRFVYTHRLDTGQETIAEVA